jgi:hypothetical protein
MALNRTFPALILLVFIFEVMTVIPLARAGLDQALIDAGWDEILFEDAKPNQFDAIREDGRVIGVNVVSDRTVSVAFLTVDTDIRQNPVLSWQWRSELPGVDTDTTREGGDDRTLAIYIAFPWQQKEASFSEKLQRPLVEALKGRNTPGRVLTYVWGGGAALGERFENPYTGKYGAMIIRKLPSTEAGKWYGEEVDIVRDFKAAFGFEPANPIYIAVGADSDDTGVNVQAAAKNFMFKPR